MQTRRRPIVGVMGSSSEDHAERARAVGTWLGREGCHLLTGGGSGVMAAVSQAFHEVPERRGLVIGIIPCIEGDPLCRAEPSYPNSWVDVPIFTHLFLVDDLGTEPMSRNHLNVLSSDVIIALPGSAGTASEVRLARRYQRPLVAYLASRSDIPDLPDETRVESDFRRVHEFVRATLLQQRERY